MDNPYLCDVKPNNHRASPGRERAAEATAGGSVYQRSQPCTAEEERPVETVQGRGMESVRY